MLSSQAQELYMSTELKESHLRSVIKGITWRVVATSTIIVIAYLTTGEIDMALKIGFIEFFIKLFLYYLHERMWQQIPRGKVRKLVGKQ